MKRRIIIGILVLGMLAMALSACGKKTDGDESETLPPGTIKTYQKMSDLEREHMYVETNEGYAEPYWGNCNFEPSEDNRSNANVVWFSEETWKMIPTVHRGQCVVYRTTAEFNETFVFTKFLDVGYTLGISNLRETDTGRFKFTASKDSINLNPSSDAYRTASLDTNVTFDALGGEPLRADRISPCGTVLGLEKDKSYPAEIYVGTEIKNCELKADSRALYGAQANNVMDYEFVQAEIIEIEIPSYFKSGYYSVNGTGIFRYIAEDTDDLTKVDFNQYNPESDAAASQLANIGHYTNQTTETLELEAGTYEIIFTYDDDINEELLEEGRTKETAFLPSVYLNLGGDNIKYLEDAGDNTLKATYEISEYGAYPLEIENLYGRTYKLDVVQQSGGETETTAEENTTEAETETTTAATP